MVNSTPLAEVWDRSISKPTENLSGLLCHAAERHKDRSAVVSLQQNTGHSHEKNDLEPISWTYYELYTKSMRLAHCLAAHGLTPGSCIVVVLYNQIEWALMFWATAHLGCQFVGVDHRAIKSKQQAQELLRQIFDHDSGVAIVVADRDLAIAIDEAAEATGGQVSLRCVVEDLQVDGWTSLADIHKAVISSEALHSTWRAEDTAVIFFTSGTTGGSKACPHTSATLYAAAQGLSKTHSISHRRTICQHLPGFHIFSVVYSVTTWLQGACLVYPSPTFDADSTIHAIARSNDVIVPCVPLMIQAMVKSPDVSQLAGHLELLIVGGSTIYPELLELCMSLSPKRIAAGYGMSECLVVASHNLPAKEAFVEPEAEVCLGSVTSGSCIRICAPGSRQVLRRCEVGEVHLGGHPVFKGYLGMAHESCYDENGVSFIISGDQGYLDKQGRLYVLGRYKDLIIRAGENISAAQIERHLSQMHNVKVCL
jgi:acyl-CoA synthetase (AMP-forming)/AMP-acid ligase II